MRILTFLVLLLWTASPLARAADLDKADLTIWTTAGQSHHFTVEIAKTETEQAKGLMFRKSMDADAGMIFPFDPAQTTEFWMKNCYIPLDMLFVAEGGRIIHIAANTTPMSETPIPSGGAVRAVVEVNGGASARLGIHVGDHVVFPGLTANP
jgi:uncharacterized membrane protein (UPF0127 family)